MHRGPVVSVTTYQKRRSTPVLLGGGDRWKRGESAHAISGSGERMRNGCWLCDGAIGELLGDDRLQPADYVVHDIITTRVVGCGSGDDDRMVESGDALPGCVLPHGGHGGAREHLEDGGVDVEHAPAGGSARRGGGEAAVGERDEGIHVGSAAGIGEDCAYGGVEVGVMAGVGMEDGAGV